MRLILALTLTLTIVAGPLFAATSSRTCDAQLQALGACSPANNGENGVIIVYWASSVDDDARPEVAADALDLRDAVCARLLGIYSGCTAAQADGAIRRLLVDLVREYRRQLVEAAQPAAADAALDNQGN